MDDFTDQINVISLTRSGTTVTIETDAEHGLSVGKQANVVGAQTPIVINSIDRVGGVATLVTDDDHDITENAGFDVQISGATEPNFNGAFKLISVPNRRTIKFFVDDSGPISATGAPLLLNGSNIYKSYNGLKNVIAVPTATSLQYTVSDSTLYTPAHGNIVIKGNPRISSSVDFDRILEAYTKQPQSKAWLFVVLGNATASKSRQIDIDATDNIQAGNFYNQKLIQSINFYVFMPSTEQIAGSDARDRCEELLKPITKSVAGVKFPSLIENNNNPLMITGHGLQGYSKAFYVHEYSFEATLQMGESDIFIPSDDVAFRDIDLTLSANTGTETFNALIDLDKDPL